MTKKKIFNLFLFFALILVSLWSFLKLYQYLKYSYFLSNLNLKTIEVVPENINISSEKNENSELFSIGYAEFYLPFMKKSDYSVTAGDCAILLDTAKYKIGFLVPFRGESEKEQSQAFNVEKQALSTMPKSGLDIVKMNIFEFEKYINLLKIKARNPFILNGIKFFNTAYIKGIISLGDGKKEKIYIQVFAKNAIISQGIVIHFLHKNKEEQNKIVSQLISKYKYTLKELPTKTVLKDIINKAVTRKGRTGKAMGADLNATKLRVYKQ